MTDKQAKNLNGMEGYGNNERFKMEQHGQDYIKKKTHLFKKHHRVKKKTLFKSLTLFKGYWFLGVECNLL